MTQHSEGMGVFSLMHQGLSRLIRELLVQDRLDLT
jgi:hypothetical protein